MNLTLERPLMQEVTEQRTLFVALRPITYAEFLDLFGEDDDVELSRGVAVKRMAAQLDHESLSAWLLTVLNYYARKKGLGVVLGSRVAVKVGEHDARLPDLLFVREDRRHILKAKGADAAPDLVIELVSPNDRPSDLIPLEADYRAIAVPEVVFIDRKRATVRVLRRDADTGDYSDETLGPGDTLHFTTLPGVSLSVDALVGDTRPEPFDILEALLAVDGGDVSD